MRITYLLLIPSLFLVHAQPSDEHIKNLIASNIAETIELRHWFHQHAELSNREFKTSERIAEELKKIGLNPKRVLPEQELLLF
jgi:hypothetical protein